MRHPLLAPALLLLASCKRAPPQEISPSSSSASGTVSPVSAAAPSASAAPVASASAAPVASASPVASAAPEDPFFGPTRLPGTRPRETVRDAGGVLLGVPAGWVTYSVYDA